MCLRTTRKSDCTSYYNACGGELTTCIVLYVHVSMNVCSPSSTDSRTDLLIQLRTLIQTIAAAIFLQHPMCRQHLAYRQWMHTAILCNNYRQMVTNGKVDRHSALKIKHLITDTRYEYINYRYDNRYSGKAGHCNIILQTSIAQYVHMQYTVVLT